MKRSFKKFALPKKLIGKILSRSLSPSLDLSSSSNESISKSENETQMNDPAIPEQIRILKEQVEHLNEAISSIHLDTDKKDVTLMKLIREKEKIALDLAKQRRINSSLVQQLEDERKFYYEEKQTYCQEMNEWKQYKKSVNGESSTNSQTVLNNPNFDAQLRNYKNEISKMKLTLSQTLEANYNLSIKFLRMKNSKSCLKNELKRIKLDYDKIVNDLKMKIEGLSTQINDLVEDKLKFTVTPSSKKYLQLVKQNSGLVYENLCLQLQVDKLNLKFDKLKIQQTKSETNKNLKYLQKGENRAKKSMNPFEAPEKLEKQIKPCCSFHTRNHNVPMDLKSVSSTNSLLKPLLRSYSDTVIKNN